MAYASPAELVRGKDETVSGVDCYVLEQADRGWTIWVGRQDFFIRRYREFIPKTAVTDTRTNESTPNTSSVRDQDRMVIETHENIIVNEDEKTLFLLAKSAILHANEQAAAD